MITPELIDLAALPSVALSDRTMLPSAPCIYFCLGESGMIHYIGRSVNLHQRWSRHHCYVELETLASVRIAWIEVGDLSLLPTIETALINHFNPTLNKRRVERSSLYTLKGLLKLAEIVQNARSSRDVTQKQFALACGLSTATICRLESGDTVKTPTDETLEKVARFIGLTREELKAIAEEREGEMNDAETSVTEIVSTIAHLSEAQLDLVFQGLIDHQSMTQRRLTQCIRLILNRLDSLE